jgi:3-hydroxyacyl-[acyl-carrier-protein] dehydratase
MKAEGSRMRKAAAFRVLSSRKGLVMPPELHFNPSTIDFNHVVVDQEAIRRVNPQRFEMEHLNGIVHIDREKNLIIGYKDVRADEFWVRGHMPDYPLLPGVLMCEAAAQLCSYYVVLIGMLEGDFIGFGGLENVRFRGVVRPGDRLVLVAKGLRFHRRQTIFNVQGLVGSTMVFHADVLGVPMSRVAGQPAEGA